MRMSAYTNTAVAHDEHALTAERQCNKQKRCSLHLRPEEDISHLPILDTLSLMSGYYTSVFTFIGCHTTLLLVAECR